MNVPAADMAKYMAMADVIDGVPVARRDMTRGTATRRQSPQWLAEASCRPLGWEVVLPVRTASEANLRSWRGRNNRTKLARAAWTFAVARFALTPIPVPVRLTVTRMGGRKLDPWDNLPVSMKSVVDAVADWLGVNDADESKIVVVYHQEIGGPWGVRVRIESTAGSTPT